MFRAHRSGGNSTHDALAAFTLRRAVFFFVLFLAGVLLAQLSDTSAFRRLGACFPEAIERLLGVHSVLPAPSQALTLAWRLALPAAGVILALFLLGLRDWDYVCLARFFHAAFCAFHGVLIQRICLLFSAAIPEMRQAVTLRMLGIVLWAAVIPITVFLHAQLLLADRICAVGVSLPCLRRLRAFGVPADGQPPLHKRLLRYFRMCAVLTLKTLTAELVLLLLVIGFRKIMHL